MVVNSDGREFITDSLTIKDLSNIAVSWCWILIRHASEPMFHEIVCNIDSKYLESTRVAEIKNELLNLR